jgi:hypothetical protein
MGDKNREEYYGTAARKIDVSKGFRDFRGFREIMDTLSSIKRIKDEPHQKSTSKRQR